MTDRFARDLSSRFADASSRDDLRRDAQAVLAAAGLLGYMDMAELCGRTRDALGAGGDVSVAARALREASDRVLRDVSASP